jgi:hypothetical protein
MSCFNTGPPLTEEQRREIAKQRAQNKLVEVALKESKNSFGNTM